MRMQATSKTTFGFILSLQALLQRVDLRLVCDADYPHLHSRTQSILVCLTRPLSVESNVYIYTSHIQVYTDGTLVT